MTRRARQAWLWGMLAILALPAIVRGQDFSYSVNGDATCIITRYSGPGGDLAIPGTINGRAVVGIADSTFWGVDSLSSVAIPQSITNISDHAFFFCSSPTAITVAVSNPAYCDQDGVLFDKGKTTLVAYPTGKPGDYTIPDGVVRVGNAAVQNCTALTSVVVPASATNLGSGAFAICNALTSIVVATDNAAYSTRDGVLFDKAQSTLILFPGGKVGDYAVPAGVTQIVDGAFQCCQSLTGITIPDGVTDTGSWVFNGCTALTNIVLSETVTSIGMCAFTGCNIANLILPSSVSSIGFSAFAYCSLTNVVFGNGIDYLDAFAFQDCANLASVYFQGSPPSANWEVFFDDHAIVYYHPEAAGWSMWFGGQPTVPLGYGWSDNGDGTCTITKYTGGGGDIAIPNGIDGLIVTTIGDAAFSQRTNLTSVTIPFAVRNIGYGAFDFCLNLTSVTIPDGVTSIGDWAFDLCALTNVAIPLGVTSIGEGTFSTCQRLASVTIPNGVTSIGDYAFCSCPRLTSVQIPDSVSSIGYKAFYLSRGLTRLTIGKSVTNVGDRAFAMCYGLTDIYFRGNAPADAGTEFSSDTATVYYLPGKGWSGASFGGRPTVLWNPQIRTDATFGVGSNCFGFTFTNAGSPTVVVEACTNLADNDWSPVATNTLTGGSSYFADPGWTNHPARFYRFRMP